MINSTFAVRAAKEDHINAVAAIYGADVIMETASFELKAPSSDEMRARFRAIAAARYPYFVAVADGEIAGYAYASAYRARPGYRYAVENSVYVKSECLGYGAGRALLGQLIVSCSAHGYR